MASPSRTVTNAGTQTEQSVVHNVASPAIGTHSSHTGGVDADVEINGDKSSGMVSSTAVDHAVTPEMFTATYNPNENVKPFQASYEDVESSENPAGEEHLDSVANNDTPDTTAQQSSQPPLGEEASQAPQLLRPTTNQLLPGLADEELHPETAAIVRQVEWYFSDENLVQDAHLLARTGITGDGWVSLNEILGFKKMRRYKPKPKVKASVATSELLEVDGKFIRRKSPLATKPLVKPKLNAQRERDAILAEKPWLTKGMLKPSGFEEYATDGPITPAQYNVERKLFDPEERFTTRIEYAATRFLGRKKMHQANAKIFNKFMFFGGFAANNMFTGGINKKELGEYDEDQILQMTAKMGVTECVTDGLDEDSDAAGSWVVDFEGMAKAFLSSEFFQHFEWTNEEVVRETTNVIRKFYDYLLYHDACPEYEDDIRNARDVCDLANQEIPKLARFDAELPGGFNTAASTLYGGYYAEIRPCDSSADWVVQGDAIGLSDQDAWTILSAGILGHGTDEQVEEIHQAHKERRLPKVTTEEDVGLEVVRIESISADAKLIYEDDRISGTFIKPTGKLHCKRWLHPGAAPRDLPTAVVAEEKRRAKDKKYEFVVESHILENCEIGMKMEANVSQLDNGFMWLDVVTNVYPTFFNWTLNERMRGWKEPGPPKKWMQRVSGETQTEEGGGEGVEADEESE